MVYPQEQGIEPNLQNVVFTVCQLDSKTEKVFSLSPGRITLTNKRAST